MAGNKQKSLTRLDNNYQINLRYPDINEFLKDTIFSLQDNQANERTLLANPRVELNSVKNVHTIVVAGYSIQLELSDIIIYGYSPDQEIIYDFIVDTEILGILLNGFTANRGTEDARLQSVQPASLYNSTSAANFNITISSKKVANLLSELFTTYAEEVKARLELADDPSLVYYVLNNLFSLSFTFFCGYRLQIDAEYQAGFRAPAALSYLRPSVLNQEAIASTKIEAPTYTPSTWQSRVKAPDLVFTGIYNLNGELQLAQAENSNTYVDSEKFNITQDTKPAQFRSNFRTADYVWRTISGAANTPPLMSYNYTFAVKNSTKKYAGVFGTFQSPATTAGSITLKASDYSLRLYNRSPGKGTVPSGYSVSVFFTLKNSNPKHTALSSFFTVPEFFGNDYQPPASTLFLQVDLLNPDDKTRVLSPHSTFERSVLLVSLNPDYAYQTSVQTQTTLSGCFLYTSANTNTGRSQFSKITQRVISTYSGVPNFTSPKIGQIYPLVGFSVSAADPKGLMSVKLTTATLTANELASLHQLTTASGFSVSLLDSFMNVLAVTDKVYATDNKLTRAESPFVNPSFVYTAEVPYTKVLLNSYLKCSISGLLTSPERSVAPLLRVLNGPKVTMNRLIDYETTKFQLERNVYCVAQWYEPALASKVPIEKWSSIMHRPTEFQIDITSTDITISPQQKISLANSLFVNVTKPPKEYSIYVLLPWTVVRDVGVKTSIIRSELISGKYTYAYAIKV